VPDSAHEVACYPSVVAAPNVKELLALGVQARLALVQELWDSIVRDAQSVADLPVTDTECRELDERLREDDEHPDAAIPWAEARARLRQDS
jgi:putative addiction module component (TIGR02574 family)